MIFLMNPSHPATLGERVEFAMQAAELTNKQVAAACGVSVQTAHAWSRGDVQTIKGPNLLALAEITGFSPQWLQHGIGPRIRVYARTDRQATVLKAMDSLTDEQAAAIEHIVKAFINTPEPNGGDQKAA